jgi:hypothetical protein
MELFIGDFELINNNPFKQKIYQYITLYTRINYDNIHKIHNDSKINSVDNNTSSLHDCVIFNSDKFYNVKECLELFKISKSKINKGKKLSIDKDVMEDLHENKNIKNHMLYR